MIVLKITKIPFTDDAVVVVVDASNVNNDANVATNGSTAVNVLSSDDDEDDDSTESNGDAVTTIDNAMTMNKANRTANGTDDDVSIDDESQQRQQQQQQQQHIEQQLEQRRHRHQEILPGTKRARKRVPAGIFCNSHQLLPIYLFKKSCLFFL